MHTDLEAGNMQYLCVQRMIPYLHGEICRCRDF